MNERIKLLADQAGFMDSWFSESGDDCEQELKKFAELIVRECMDAVREQYLPVLEDELMMKDTHWDGYVQCGVDSYVAIREHFFGVEE
jgi:hypothetical protein